VKSTIDLGVPGVVLRCAEHNCSRQVGPYFDPREAQAAMATHVWIKHAAVAPGRHWWQGWTDQT
jgi:hypothetical protein